MSSIPKIILGAVKSTTEQHPIDLADLLHAIDADQRIMASAEELNEALGGLIQSRQVAETGRLRFYDPAGAPTARTFKPITKDEHEAACALYGARFDTAMQELEKNPGDYVRHIISLRWKVPGGGYPEDEEEEKAQELAERIHPILERSGRAEINGFEFGPGTLDIVIFGRDTDTETDSIYGDIVSAFRTTECPRGSCIIRYYRDTKTEKVSDVVE